MIVCERLKAKWENNHTRLSGKEQHTHYRCMYDIKLLRNQPTKIRVRTFF